MVMNKLKLKLKLLSIQHPNYLQFKRCVCQFESNYQIFTRYFGLPEEKAKRYIKAERLQQLDTSTLMRTITFCSDMGYDNKSILKNPILLRSSPLTLDQHYQVMLEGGFKQHITAPVLAKFRTFCKRKVTDLKGWRLIDENTDVAKCFITNLSPCPKDFYVRNGGDFDNWADIHFRVLCEYLKWRLKVTDTDIDKLVATHRSICRKSFRYLCQNIAFAEELGFTPDKIVKCGYILHSYPKYNQEVLAQFPNIAGACMKRAMKMYPKLVTVSPSNIEKIYGILKKHGIPDIAIQKRMNVFHLSPETVDIRLQELKNVADLKVLFHNPNVLKLVVHHTRAKSRLRFLKELQLKCAGVTVLGNDGDKFDVHVREGRDENTFSDLSAFLKGLLNESVDQFAGVLRKHPYYLKVPFVSMEDTYFYLKSEKFSNASILNAIYILLYPREDIINGFKKLQLCEELNKKHLSELNKLNLVLYFIEKEHHFSGDGIWTKTDEINEGNTFT